MGLECEHHLPPELVDTVNGFVVICPLCGQLWEEIEEERKHGAQGRDETQAADE
jgi:hypothetical protein